MITGLVYLLLLISELGERIRVNGKPLYKIEEWTEQLHPIILEICEHGGFDILLLITVMRFLNSTSKQKVDLAIIETGLEGG